MSTGSKEDNQFATTGDGDSSGGNASGPSTLKSVKTYIVQPFQGKSGQPNNQETDRGKGTN